MGHFVTARGNCTKFLALRQWASQRGGEEGLRPQSQEGQDLSAAGVAEQLIFKTSTEKQTVHLTNKDLTKDSERFSSWLHSAWRTTGPIRWHAAAGGCMRVQTCGDTCEGACAAEQRTKNTMQLVPGLFCPHWWGQKIKPPSTSLFLVPRAVVAVHFDGLCSTRRTCSCSQHESFCTSLRKYVVPAHFDWTPGCHAHKKLVRGVHRVLLHRKEMKWLKGA